MNSEVSNLISELETISDGARKTFGNLSTEQINWKPSADGWSVGQCFEHLMKANALFFPDLDRIAAGERQSSLLEKYSPLSSFFGNLLISSLKKDERKIKAPTKKIVPPSEIDPNVIELFAAHQIELIGKIKRTENADWDKTKITSPFFRMATYSLANGFRIVVEHERRHVRQAQIVLASENFPK